MKLQAFAIGANISSAGGNPFRAGN